MSDDSEKAPEQDAPRKKGKRRAIYVLIPEDINNLDAEPDYVPPSPEPDEDGKRDKVQPYEFKVSHLVYAIPSGPGQKAAIRQILAKHNIDLRNIGRVRMFSGEKKFKIETQYNIRF